MKQLLHIGSFCYLWLFTSSIIISAQNNTQQYLLLEEFTNTYCPTCIDKHPEFKENILNKQEDATLFHIAYHHSTPLPDDIFYQANPVEEGERAAYYQVQGTPTVLIQGKRAPQPVFVSDPLLPQTTLDEALNQTAPIAMAVNEVIDGETRKVNIKVNILGNIPSGQWKLRAAVVEKVITYEPPHEGMETVMSNVFRQTLTSWTGAGFINLPAGNALTYNYDYTIKDDWEANQIYVIAFLQNDQDQSILNVASSWGQTTVLHTQTQTIAPHIHLSPNPTTDILNIQLPPSPQPLKVQLYDAKGQLLAAPTYPQTPSKLHFSLNNLPKGIFYIKIDINGTITTQKVLKI